MRNVVRALGVLVIFVLTASAFSQNTMDTPTASATRYPVLTRAEVPLYPPIARAAHITGTVEIRVVVEKGAVVDAQVKSVVLGPSDHVVLNKKGKKKASLYLSNPSLANVKTWQFQSEGRTTFLVTYVYKIEGEQTLLPESPKVELDLPRLVTVTAKPFKPYCSDCGADISGMAGGPRARC